MTKKVKTGSIKEPRRNRATPFKVVDIKEKPETDENFHKKIVKDGKKKKKFNLKPAIKLLLEEDNDLKDLDANIQDEDLDDNDYQSDSEDGGEYEAFMEEMSKLDGKKRRIVSERTEGTGEVSEFNLSTRKGGKVSLTNLLSSLDKTSEEANTANVDIRSLSKRLVTKDKSEGELSAPLEGPAADRVTRAAGYVGVKKEISVWDAVVHSRRAADQVSLPLNKPEVKLQTVTEAVKERFKPETPLEQQIAALLSGSKAVVREGEEFSEIELKGLQGLTAREAAERKAELAKVRALQTYQEAKYRRQGKIKSKKYRKIARKEKSKEKLAEIEEMAKNDPEAAAEELANMEKARIEERASLKHRNASKYLKEQAKRAKFDKGAKTELNDQLRHHRELLTKHGEKFDDTVDEVDVEAPAINMDCEMLNRDKESFQEFSSGYRKFWNNEQQKKEKEKEELEEIFEDAEFNLKQRTMNKIESLKKGDVKDNGAVEEKLENDDKDELIPDDSLNFKVRPDTDQSLVSKAETLNQQMAAKEATSLPDVDPENFLTAEPKKIGGSDLPEIIGYDEADQENMEDNQADLIAEAFADDDVMELFKAEKAALVAASKPKDIDMTLPGWGEWGGGGAKPSKRKRKRFTVKAPPQPKRRDENQGHLILNIEKDTKLREHQVSRVPFPFTSVSDYEASIRAPVGSTFLPRTAHLKMIKPRLKTRAGTVIEPMDREQLVKRGIIKVKGGGGLGEE